MKICADDFGLSQEVNDGIIRLAEARKIDAFSCLVTCSNFEKLVPRLISNVPAKGIGLHLSLTEGAPLSKLPLSSGLISQQGTFASFTSVLIGSLFRKIDGEAVYQELQCQCQKFYSLFGRWPDFIDGHQHIHQLPVINEQIIRLVKKLPSNKSFYVRSSCFPTRALLTGLFKLNISTVLKNLIFHCIGKHFTAKLNKHGIRHNRYLLGTYSFMFSRNNHANLFNYYLNLTSNSNDLFYCHPAYISKEIESQRGDYFFRNNEFKLLNNRLPSK